MAQRKSIPLDRWLRRRRIVAVCGTLGAIVLATVALMRTGGVMGDVDALDRRPVAVTGVIDGRTIAVRLGETPRTVRLLGLKIEEGQTGQATEKLTAAIGDQPVTLAFDIDRLSDETGALLAYVYGQDGKLINETLIAQHAARPDGSRHMLSDWLEKLDRRVNPRKK